MRFPAALLTCFLCLNLAPALAQNGTSVDPAMVQRLQELLVALDEDTTRLSTLGDEMTILHHDLAGTINPTEGTYAATATEQVRVRIETRTLHLLLFRDFAVSEVQVTRNGQPLAATWSATPLASDLAADQFLLDFPEGPLPEPLERETFRQNLRNLQVITIQLPSFTQAGAEYAITTTYAGPYGDLGMDPYTGEAVYFNGNNVWFPDLYGPTSTFELQLTVPATWSAYAQGNLLSETVRGGERRLHFKSEVTQGQIVVIAGAFVTHRETRDGIEYATYFFPDTANAVRDLPLVEKSQEYIDFFADLIGDYPYESFAIIETHAPVGQGYPGFTLLGTRVMSAHFLDPYSLGHEILHSWFGNWVVWDGTGGNWTEGLTYTLANLYYDEVHQGAEHARQARKRTLEDIAYTLRWAQDPPSISDFVSSDGGEWNPAVSQSVGYHKLGMLIHSWRAWLGDEAFFAMLRNFVANFGGRTANLDDLTGVLFDALQAQGKAAGDRADWVAAYRAAWYEPQGMPFLLMDHVFLTRDESNGTYAGEAVLRMDKFAGAFLPPLRMTIYDGSFEDPDLVYTDQWLPWNGTEVHADFKVARPPNWIEFDAGYDQLRWIPDSEKTPSLEFLRGTGPVSIVIPDRHATALHGMNLNLPALFFGATAPSFFAPDAATAERVVGQNLVAVGTLADLPWITDLLSPPLGINEGLQLQQVARGIAPEFLDLGDNDALFMLVKNEGDPTTCRGVLLGRDLDAVAALLKKLSFYPTDSLVVLKDNLVVRHERLPVEIRSLRYPLRDAPQPE